MEKYRGPSDQHSRMERKYFAQLIHRILTLKPVFGSIPF